MEMIIIVLLVVLIGAIFWSNFYAKKAVLPDNSLNQRIDSLSQNVTGNLNEITKTLLSQMNDVSNKVDFRIKENTACLNEGLKGNREEWQRSHRTIGERLDNAAKSYSVVNSKLTKLEEETKRIYEVGKDIASLQEILKTPKLRGSLGELFLGDLLAQVLPTEHFSLQYTFKNGAKIDAVIRVKDNQLVPVDAKFPLENFKKMITEEKEANKKANRKLFISDVKKHIDDIAAKYIIPAEGTLDFALMYIPAENVYYELIVKDDEELYLMSYALNKRVIPVSPNSFYSYLQTILMGLKGMKIEQKAKEIWQFLGTLKKDMEKFQESFNLTGTHLGRAQNSYMSSEKYLDKFANKLLQVEGGKEQQHELLLDGSVDKL